MVQCNEKSYVNLCQIAKPVFLWSINTIMPSDTTWSYRSGSTFAHVMACCLMRLSNYLNQCLLLISVVLWHSPERNFTTSSPAHIQYDGFENHTFKIPDKSPRSQWVNTLRLGQNGHHLPDDIFKCIFLKENVWILIKISLNFVPKGPTNNISALVQVMAWRRPLSEPMMVSSLTHIYASFCLNELNIT